jgi:chaperonin cofactor prefoldin
MNFQHLTPEHRRLLMDLHKRIEALEARLLRLQNQIVKIEAPLMHKIARKANFYMN